MLTKDNNKGVSNFPNIAVSRNNNSVYVVWSRVDSFDTTNQTQTYDVFFTRSIDRGDTFRKPINLSNDPSNSQNAALAVSRNDGIYVAWTDNFIGTYEVFFTKSMDGGNTFSTVMVISSNVARALSPSISANGNGSTFNLPININNDTGVSDLAQISSGNGGGFYLVYVYVVWNDDTFGNPDIFFTRSIDSGSTFNLRQDNIAGNSMIYLTKTD